MPDFIFQNYMNQYSIFRFNIVSAIPSDDAGYVLDSSPSPQAGCFQFRRRTRGSYSLDNRNFNNRGGSSNILRRLGLPVRGGRQQYDDRKNQQQFNPRRPRDGRVTFWNRVMVWRYEIEWFFFLTFSHDRFPEDVKSVVNSFWKRWVNTLMGRYFQFQ